MGAGVATLNRIIKVKNPADLEQARSRYYARLGDHFMEQLGRKRIHRVLEAGAGKGQLTIPLLERFPRRTSMTVLDSNKGDYAGSFQVLQSRLHQSGYEERVHIIWSDVRKIRKVPNGTLDAVVSNELLPDLKTKGDILKAFKGFHRILRPGGVLVQGEWMSQPVNEAQELAIRADSPGGTDTSSRFWNPDELSAHLRAAGFQQEEVTYFQTTLSLRYEVALVELRNWGVRESFINANQRRLKRYGIELPFEHVISARKPA